eukprot:4345633-Prymnesium_polylepis.1
MSAFFPPRGQKAEIFDRRQHCTSSVKWIMFQCTSSIRALASEQDRHDIVTILSQYCHDIVIRLKWIRLKDTACLARLVHRNTSNPHRHCRHKIVTISSQDCDNIVTIL